MNWTKLQDEQTLDQLREESFSRPILIFKHSTRCSISATAIDRLDRYWKDEEMKEVKAVYLDLLNYRPLSQKIAQDYHIEHESPQVLLIRDGKCVYHASHGEIRYDTIRNIKSKL